MYLFRLVRKYSNSLIISVNMKLFQQMRKKDITGFKVTANIAQYILGVMDISSDSNNVVVKRSHS